MKMLRPMFDISRKPQLLLSGNKYNVGPCRYLKKAPVNIEVFEKGEFRLGYINDF